MSACPAMTTHGIARGALTLLAAALLLHGCAPPEPPAAEAAVAVRTEVLARRDLQPTLSLLGTLAPAERRPVQATAPGTLRYAPRFASGLEAGAEVRAGELLATIASLPNGERLSEARLAERAAVQELARVRRGAEQGVLPHADLERAEMQAEAARLRTRNATAESAHLELRAPAGGRLLVERPVASGSEVEAGLTLAEIATGAAARIEALAAASDQSRLAPGLAARVLSADGTRPLAAATLREVATGLTGGALRVVAVLEDAGAVLPPPGSGVVLDVLLPVRGGVLTVPEQAVIELAGTPAVYVVPAGADRPRVERRTVRLGARGEGRVEVTEGLAVGDRVATSGVALLQPGTVVVESAPAAGGGA